MQDRIITIIITQRLNSLCHIPAQQPPVSPFAHAPTTTFKCELGINPIVISVFWLGFSAWQPLWFCSRGTSLPSNLDYVLWGEAHSAPQKPKYAGCYSNKASEHPEFS